MPRVSTLTPPRPSRPARPDGGLLTLDQAAAYLQIAPGTLKQWALQRRVEHVKVGKYMRFTQAALDAYIAGQTVRVKVEVP